MVEGRQLRVELFFSGDASNGCTTASERVLRHGRLGVAAQREEISTTTEASGKRMALSV